MKQLLELLIVFFIYGCLSIPSMSNTHTVYDNVKMYLPSYNGSLCYNYKLNPGLWSMINNYHINDSNYKIDTSNKYYPLLFSIKYDHDNMPYSKYIGTEVFDSLKYNWYNDTILNENIYSPVSGESTIIISNIDTVFSFDMQRLYRNKNLFNNSSSKLFVNLLRRWDLEKLRKSHDSLSIVKIHDGDPIRYLSRIIISNGAITDINTLKISNHTTYITAYQGNIRAVVDSLGSVVQSTDVAIYELDKTLTFYDNNNPIYALE